MRLNLPNPNFVNINGQNIAITNTTMYNPDSVISNYVALQGTSVVEEIQNWTQYQAINNINLQQAAQDLFDRAVASEQHYVYVPRKQYIIEMQGMEFPY